MCLVWRCLLLQVWPPAESHLPSESEPVRSRREHPVPSLPTRQSPLQNPLEVSRAQEILCPCLIFSPLRKEGRLGVANHPALHGLVLALESSTLESPLSWTNLGSWFSQQCPFGLMFWFSKHSALLFIRTPPYPHTGSFPPVVSGWVL